ncbi:MAG: hypothetical protein ABH834_04320 [Candidatus Altiarchaeota archaeon]
MLSDSVDKIMSAIETEDAMQLRQLSREFSEDAVTDQSRENIDLAMITYCLNKLFSKVHFKENLAELKQTVAAELSSGNFEAVLDEIKKFDQEFGAFEGTLVNKARIKVGARLYSNGLSLSQSASMTDVSVSDILAYVGATKTHEKIKPMNVSERYSFAKKILGNE